MQAMPRVLYQEASSSHLHPWQYTALHVLPASLPRIQATHSFQKFNTPTTTVVRVKARQQQVMAALSADKLSMKAQATNAAQPSVRKLKMLELFSGLGGMHSSVARAVANDVIVNVVAIDINTAANEIYALNFQNTAMPSDLEKITATQLDAYAADLWTLSPPCQPYTSTTCSKQLDTEDPRAASFVNLMRQLPLMKNPPKYMMLENVAGFIGSNGHQLLLQTLTANGYNIQQFLLSPEQFGIPYLRPRYFALAKRSPLTFQNSSPPHTIQSLPPLIPWHLALRCMPPTMTAHGLADEQFLHAISPSCIAQYLRMAIQDARTFDKAEPCSAPQEAAQEVAGVQAALPDQDADGSGLKSDGHVGILNGRNDGQSDEWAVPAAAWQQEQLCHQKDDSNQQASTAHLSSQESLSGMTQHTIGIIPQQHQTHHTAQSKLATTADLSEPAVQQNQGSELQSENITRSQQTKDEVALPTINNQQETATSTLCTPVGTEFCHHLGLFLDSISPSQGDTALWQQHALGDKTLARWWKVLDVVTADSRHCNCITKHYARNLVGAGSVLATREFASMFCRVDPRGRTHIPRDPYAVAQELGPSAQLLLKEIRFLSPSEVCKLHGLDQDFRFTDNAPSHTAMRCLGNSLSVDVCAWLAVLLLT